MNDRHLENVLTELPDQQPPTDTVERHRRALQKVIDQPTQRSEVGSRGGRAAVAAGFVLLISAAVLVVTLWNPRDDNEIASNRSPSTPATSSPMPGGGCAAFAAEHPVDVPLGFTGPENRGVNDSPSPPSPEQLVQTWTSGTTEIEARWPADPDLAQTVERIDPNAPFTPPFPGAMPAPAASLTSSGFKVLQAPSGRTYVETVFAFNALSDTCETAQLRVYDQDPLKAGSVSSSLTNHPFESGVPLVTSSETVDAVPSAIACSATGEKRRDAVDLGEFPTAEAALATFVKTESGISRDGWVEHRLPDGSIAYAHIVDAPPRPELGWVAVLHVVRSGSGWAIDYFEGSGC